MKQFSPILCACVLATVLSAAASAEVRLKDKWVYVSTNLLVQKNVDQFIALMEHSKKAGYTGILLADYKFGVLDRQDERYFTNARRAIASARELDIELIPAVFPIGYASAILAHDPNLIEGLPVVDAPLEARGGKLVPLMPEGTKLASGDFEELDSRGGFAGWWQENIGRSVFADRDVVRHGQVSVRMQDIARQDPRYGHCRLHQLVKTEPFKVYHLGVWIKTEDFDAPGAVRLQVLAKKPETLTYQDLDIKRTQDWTHYDVVFNSLENAEARIYCGVWGGKSGKLWWDDLVMEPGGFVNVIRRDACPVKLTSADGPSPAEAGASARVGGKTTYLEGRDFSRIVDPKLGNERYPGTFAAWHTPPEVTVPADSRIREGQRVLASYFHPMIVGDSQVTSSLLDPKVYTLLEDEFTRVHRLFQAKRYMMSHDEIRVGGWTPDYAGKTMGEVLAMNVRKCCEIIRKHAPQARICVWSDMFDPNHNARADYYLVKTTWAGSWEGLPKDTVLVDWYAGVAPKTLAFFHSRGHEQILAGYYDGNVEANVKTWMDSAKASPARVTGIIYTTWRSDYANLEKFIEEVRKYER